MGGQKNTSVMQAIQDLDDRSARQDCRVKELTAALRKANGIITAMALGTYEDDVRVDMHVLSGVLVGVDQIEI